MSLALLIAAPLLVCQPPAVTPSESCIPTVAGLDTSCATSGGFMHYGESIGQTFDALSRKVRRITVWRPAYEDTNAFGLHLFVFGTDSVGAPAVHNVILDGPTETVLLGDGVHPVRMDFILDPPLTLPTLGRYAIGFKAEPCFGDMTLLASEQPGGGYAQGIYWHSNRTYPQCFVGAYTGYPESDLVFEIEFCQTTICAIADESSQATLQAPDGWVISDIDVASYGNPTGAGLMTSGTCESPRSREVVESACLGQPGCTVAAEASLFGDPCPGTPKRLAIQATIHPAASDLMVSRFDVPAIAGTPLPVSYTVVNRGSKPSGPFGTSIRISADAAVDEQDAVVWSRQEADIAPGDSITVSASLQLPPEPRGRVFLEAIVDAANQVDEQLESNNRQTVPFTLGSARILSISDVLNDQGGKVAVRALASDPEIASSIVSYDVYRKDADVWRFDASVPAITAGEYVIEASTATDSTGPYFNASWFLVRAVSAEAGVFYDSPPMLGYSVDNLAPPIPPNISAQYLPRQVRLRWGRDLDRDVAGYRIYRLNAPDFRPSPTRLVAVLTDTAYTDSLGTVFTTYGVSAVDVHGNEGPVATVAYGKSLRFDLVGVTPNPVTRGPVSVSFMLQTSRPVHLELLDVAGRRLSRQEVGHLGPGFHTVPIDRQVSPGLYFVRLILEDATGALDIRSRKLTVLR